MKSSLITKKCDVCEETTKAEYYLTAERGLVSIEFLCDECRDAMISDDDTDENATHVFSADKEGRRAAERFAYGHLSECVE